MKVTLITHEEESEVDVLRIKIGNIIIRRAGNNSIRINSIGGSVAVLPRDIDEVEIEAKE